MWLQQGENMAIVCNADVQLKAQRIICKGLRLKPTCCIGMQHLGAMNKTVVKANCFPLVLDLLDLGSVPHRCEKIDLRRDADVTKFPEVWSIDIASFVAVFGDSLAPGEYVELAFEQYFNEHAAIEITLQEGDMVEFHVVFGECDVRHVFPWQWYAPYFEKI